MKKYTIGLDIGTNSVGWAVIDDDFKLVKGKKTIDDNGKIRKTRTNLWGVELFDDGKSARDRRLKRGNRRRLKRRRERINYLRGIFEEEILKVDEGFFIRLDESFLQSADKKTDGYYVRNGEGKLIYRKAQKSGDSTHPIFPSESEEKSYWKNFPTIYHLRDYLMNTRDKADIRLIYLGLHHILKYRGHFINQGQSFDLNNINVASAVIEMLKDFEEALNYDLSLSEIDENSINKILCNSKISKTGKVDRLLEECSQLYGQDQELKKQLKGLMTAAVGNKISLSNIFNNQEYSPKNNENIPKDLYYSKESFDEDVLALEGILNENEYEIILEGKKVYEAITLSKILTEKTLSASMVKKYENHQEQLRQLKDFAKDVSYEKLYKKIFGKDGSYTQYIEGKGDPAKVLTRDEFYKEFKKNISSVCGLDLSKTIDETSNVAKNLSAGQKAYLSEVKTLMEFDDFLPKQRVNDNGAIPYQVHEHELVKILENQGKFYPFLSEKSGDEYKIQKLMKFRIPYYVGPLTEATDGQRGSRKSSKSDFAWMQKKIDEKITPWNFDDVVDKDASSIEFIERMTSYCTYLPNEKVLAQNTLLYQEFCVYNELVVSGYTECGKKHYFGMDKELLNDIVNRLFKNGKSKKVSVELLKKYLDDEWHIYAEKIFGVDERSANGKPAFNNTLGTYHDLINLGISKSAIDNNREIFDEIVTWQTIFTDNKTLKKKITSGNEQWRILTDEQVEKLSQIHYKGFGSLSRKLLDGIRDESTGLTILETLKNGGRNNFMRLISGETADSFTFKEQIEKAQQKDVRKITDFEIVESIAGSHAIKRGIWQSLKILRELEKYLGRENISKVVIEMSREDSGGRTKSRHDKLMSCYKDFKERNNSVFEELKNIDGKKLDDEKIYLYFMQNGVDAYDRNHQLSLNRLSEYEVDHIIPQCFIRDNSFDNKVLVSKESNQRKGGDVPSHEIVFRMKPIWESWMNAKLISPKKLKHLETEKLTEKAKEGFINRQLVENRQITKHVASIICSYFEDTDTVVLTPKAGLTSQFRKGKLFFPNPEFDKKKAEENPREYNVKRFITKDLHLGFPKDRNLNDYHHAHDAYLNAIVALYLYRQYPELKNAWVYGDYQRDLSSSMGKFVRERKEKSMQLLSDMIELEWNQTDPDTGEVFAFNRDNLLAEIEKTLGYRNVNVVSKTEFMSGKFGDESIYVKPKKEGIPMTPLKNHLNCNLYGGRKSPISACMALVESSNGTLERISIPAMYADEYIKALNKLEFLKVIYPESHFKRIIVERVDKYTKFENNVEGIIVSRLVSSYAEARKADSFTLSVSELRDLANKDEKTMLAIYDKMQKHIERNAVLNKSKSEMWKNSLRSEFIDYSIDEKQKFIYEAFSIVRRGPTNAKILVEKKKISEERQRHRTTQYDLIKEGSTIIYQSPTGLYETRKTISL